MQLAAVRGDRSLAGAAIEEALRWDGPVLASSRLATTDTVVDGVPVPAGAFIDLLYGAANHDPAVFPDPETFDIFRPKHRHFGFAFGAHNCLGQQLARLELSRALNAVLDELPDLRLDPDHPCPQARGALMRTPKELRVVFGDPRWGRHDRGHLVVRRRSLLRFAGVHARRRVGQPRSVGE